MPDEPKDGATGETPAATATPATTTPPTTPPTTATTAPEAPPILGSDGQPFDAARAQRTIEALRVKEKALEAAQKQLAVYEKAKKDAEDATLSENARLAKQVEEAKTALTTQKAADQARVARLAVELAASRANLANPALAYRLIDTAAIVYDEAGHPTNTAALLADLVAENPYLVKAAPAAPAPVPAPPAPPAAPGIRATNGAGAAAPAAGRRYSQAELGDFRFYTEHKEDINRAMAEGRID